MKRSSGHRCVAPSQRLSQRPDQPTGNGFRTGGRGEEESRLGTSLDDAAPIPSVRHCSVGVKAGKVCPPPSRERSGRHCCRPCSDDLENGEDPFDCNRIDPRTPRK